MAIDVRHEIDPALMGALSYLAARQQYRQRQNELERGIEQWIRAQPRVPTGLQDLGPVRDQLVQERPSLPSRNANVAPARPVTPASQGTLATAAIEEDRDILKNRDRIRGKIVDQLLIGRQRQDLNHFGLVEHDLDRQARADRAVARYANDSATSLEAQIKDAQSKMAKRQQQLTPERRRFYGELVGKLRAIHQSRGFSPPAEYTRLLGRWLEEYERSGIQNHIQEPPSVRQYVAENALDNGKGFTFVRQPGGRIRPLQTADPQPSEQELERKREDAQRKRERQALDLHMVRTRALANWLASAPWPPDFIRMSLDPHGKTSSVFDQKRYTRAKAAWEALRPRRPLQVKSS